MASSAISFIVTCTCVLLFAQGHHAAISGGQALAREKELPWERSAEKTSPARGAGVKGANTGLVLARRELAVRLGGASKGSSPAKGTVKGAVHPSDAAALQKAAAQWKKDKSTVDERKLLATWDVKRPCSQWFGVTCSSTTHRVTAIKLPKLEKKYLDPYFDLWGPFPAELGSLPELRSLVLARNHLWSGRSFPMAWARLAKLSYLDLSGNTAGDWTAVPLALCNLTSLTYLNMADTAFAKLPKQFKSLKKLAWLDLTRIGLGSEDVQTLGSLTRLRTLFLTGSFFRRGSNAMPSVVNGLSALRGLKLLDLSENNFPSSFWKTIPPFLKSLTGLDDLRLNSITGGVLLETRVPGGPVPPWLGRLQQLTSLDLSSNNFSSSLPTQLGALPKLAKLVLSENSLTGGVPQAISNSRSLTHINLSGNRLSLTEITFGPHASSRLKRLDLSQNNLKGTIPKGLSSLTSLETLSLSDNLLSGTLPQFLWTIPTLSKLVLSRNSLTGLGPSSQKITAGRIKSLDLSFNRFLGSIPKGWSALERLTSLSLKDNQLKGSIPSWLGALRGLASLDLSYNQLTGSIPGSVFRASLKLSLGHNQLSGNLPATALDLWAERLLEARKNSASFGALLVDVSKNYLTGPCYRSSLPWVRNASWTGCMPFCPGPLEEELSGLFQNCLQGCKIPGRDALPDPTEQRSNGQCAQFCGADKRNGPCNGHGSCSLEGPKKTPTCACSKGFVAPASKPGTCVPAPKL